MKTQSELDLEAEQRLFPDKDDKFHWANSARKSAFRLGIAHRDQAVEELIARNKVLDNALNKIDWHIRGMQNDKIISMSEMCRALKVISDEL